MERLPFIEPGSFVLDDGSYDNDLDRLLIIYSFRLSSDWTCTGLDLGLEPVMLADRWTG